MPRLNTLLGDSSYAIYVIHYPLSVLAVWAAGRLHIAPCYALQFAFLGLVAALSWGASILDLRVRAMISLRTRGPRRASEEAAALPSTERL
jgi:peptidoglycan/LPS O-acetylase OafA/YrhL